MAELKEAKLKKIPIGQITESASALRKPKPKTDAYMSLVDSVRTNGILNPISVREMKDPVTGDVRYAVIDGLHRFFAARDAGLDFVPAQILQMTAEEVRLAQIIANVQKIETRPAAYSAQLVKILNDQPTWGVPDLMVRLSRSKTWVENRLKLDKLPDPAKILVDDHKMTVVNAYALADLMEVAPEEVQDYYDRAQTESPAVFVQEVNTRIKSIRDARRAGRVPGANLTYNPYAHLRANKEIKEEFVTPKFAHQVIGAMNAKTALEGFAAAIAWVIRMDPLSVQEDAVHFEKKKAEETERKRLVKEETERHKALKATQDTAAAMA